MRLKLEVVNVGNLQHVLIVEVGVVLVYKIIETD